MKNIDKELISKVKDKYLKDYLIEIDSKPLLSIEEEKDLIYKIMEGNKAARNYFIECNLRNVVNIAINYIDSGLDLQELIQAGNLGLVVAVNNLNLKREYKFSTHIAGRVRYYIIKAIKNKEYYFNIPSHMQEQIRVFNHTMKQMNILLGRTPSIEEIAIEMEITSLDAFELYQLSQGIDSLNINEQEIEFEEAALVDNKTPERLAVANDLLLYVLGLYDEARLTEKEKDIFKLRFGLYDGIPRTNKEISDIYGITHVRIHQIEEKTRKKNK